MTFKQCLNNTLNSINDGVLIDLGNEFHKFRVVLEKERSYSVVRELGIEERSFSVDLSHYGWLKAVSISC